MHHAMRRLLPIALVVVLAGCGHSRSSAVERPANAQLPWHTAVVGSDGALLPWATPDGTGFDRVLRLGWTFLEQQVPIDTRTHRRVYLNYATYNAKTLQGGYWQDNPASAYAGLVSGVLQWYAYAGDERAVGIVRTMLDYQLRHGTTPRGWAWPGVPYATACAGATAYGGCLAGLPRTFSGGIEPDKIGELGLAYLKFYELTGETRFLRAGVQSADVLARQIRDTGDARTPWAFRVDARTGRTLDGAQFGGAVVGPLSLLDEALRLHVGATAPIRAARDRALHWLIEHQLNPASPDGNRWTGFYEDVPYNPAGRNQAVPMLTAAYLIRGGAAVDPRWSEHARALVTWVSTHFAVGPYDGATGIDEQAFSGGRSCCSNAGLGSDTARFAAVEAQLSARTGAEAERRTAMSSLAYASYFSLADGRVSCCGASAYRNPFWFTDGYSDYLQYISQALGALPTLAPPDQDHLLASTSVVQRVRYDRGSVRYRTFDADSRETLRLAFRPVRVESDGRRLRQEGTLRAEGYSVRTMGDGDFVVRISHRGHNVGVLG
ncbi:MAG: hypothetical protein ABI317_16800 [Gaiellales bacterium]